MRSDLPIRFDETEAADIAFMHWNVRGQINPLDSYSDQNFLIESNGATRHVLKIYNPHEMFDAIEFQTRMVEWVASRFQGVRFPHAKLNKDGRAITTIEADGKKRYVCLLQFVPGRFWGEEENLGRAFLWEMGRFLGELDNSVKGFAHPGAHRDMDWDLANARRALASLPHIENPQKRSLAQYFLQMFEVEVAPHISKLAGSVIHNDANPMNVLVRRKADGSSEVSGLIDFGDAVYTRTLFELAIAASYATFDEEDPIGAVAEMVRGYHSQCPLGKLETQLLFYLVTSRLLVSVCSSAQQIKNDPLNEYLQISEKPAWRSLEKLSKMNPVDAQNRFLKACDLGPKPGVGAGVSRVILESRKRFLGSSLSLAYEKPLHITRGYGPTLFDDQGAAYLDMVNNVSHVGHCHPRVVRAANEQASRLNTNTRYLHPLIVKYAERLTATMPDPLRVCYFVCSGSEANELALRMARTHTGRQSAVVVDGAYHGNTSSIIELSPYKFDGKGGEGARDHVTKVVMPDLFRGPYKSSDPEAGAKYAGHVKEALRAAEESGWPAALFISESLLSCGGQIVPPVGYLKEALQHVREAGAVFVADEVQVGFGRVGTHFWGFETQDVVPDIVTMGKPMGNGHPLSAVITTREIAESFDNGMEYFNTFGGNPVSCAIGMAVLDVIEEEELQKNALEVGGQLMADLEQLKTKHPLIGDVRGLGLFIGVELVRDRETLEPASEEARRIVEAVKERHILLSTDGPLHNVLKIKPPMVLTSDDADRFVRELDAAFQCFS